MKSNIVTVSSFACEFACTFPTAEAAATFEESLLAGEGPIASAEVAQTAFMLGGSVRAVSGVESLLTRLPNVEPDAYADTIATIRAAAPSLPFTAAVLAVEAEPVATPITAAIMALELEALAHDLAGQ